MSNEFEKRTEGERPAKESFPGSKLSGATTQIENEGTEQRGDASMGSEFKDLKSRGSEAEGNEDDAHNVEGSSDISHVDVNSDPEEDLRQ